MSQELVVMNGNVNAQLEENKVVKKYAGGTGELAQRLKALAALPKDPGSVPSTHKTNGL